MIFDAHALKSRVEQGWIVGESTSTWKSITEEPYSVIGSQNGPPPKEPGTVDEGAQYQWAYDRETAYWSALACFESYAHGKTGVLYWRIPPTLEVHRVHYRFYMRCLISDKTPSREAA